MELHVFVLVEGSTEVIFFMSTHIYFPFSVLNTLFHKILDVVRSEVLVAILPG